MRICGRCQSEMIEGLDIKVHGHGYGVEIATGTGLFTYSLGKPKVAVCRKCGEISLYVENIEDIDKVLEDDI